MTSNNEWITTPQKRNSLNKKSRENQIKSLRQLEELFGSIYESDVLESVAKYYNWKVDYAVEALVNLSSTYVPQSQSAVKISKKTEKYTDSSWISQKSSNVDNIEEMIDSKFQNTKYNFKLSEHEVQKICKKMPKVKNLLPDKDVKPEQPRSEPSMKVGTESLCGLKVQYRLKGTENSDDDADVVIEEESSDYIIDTPEPEHVNVCQFMSMHTQCSPRNTFPKVTINTPSSAMSQCSSPSISTLIESRIEADINKGYKILIIMRGAPGSGKTCLARSIVTRTMGGDYTNHIFSADDYFLKINRGVYVFDSSKVQEAHYFNFKRVLQALQQGRSPIIVDNTNTRAWEMQHFACMAVPYGYIVETLEPNTPWFFDARELERRNTYGLTKAKIRVFLDRYEPNITGKHLLKMFSLKYHKDNQPPQIRQIPPFLIEKQIAVAQPNPNDYYFHKPTDNDQTKLLIDNEALNTIAQKYSKPKAVAKNTRNSNAISVIKSFDESWTAGSSYKEDSLPEISKLGAIGSERRVAQGAYPPKLQDNNIEQSQTELKVEMLTEITTDAPEDYGDVERMMPETKKDSTVSNCWDFTLLLDGRQIHSKFENTDSNEIAVVIDKLVDKSNLMNSYIEDTEVSCILSAKLNDDFLSIEDPRTSSEPSLINLTELNLDTQPTFENFHKIPTPDVLQEIPTLIDTRSNSHSSSLERVSDIDISQFEICNAELVDEMKKPNDKLICEHESAEKQSSGGSLGLLFNFIKNSFIGNDKETYSKQMQPDNTDTPEVSIFKFSFIVSISCDNQPDNVLGNESPIKKSFSPTLLLEQSLDLSKDDVDNNDSLPIDVTGSDNYFDGSLINVSLDNSSEFLESSENPQKESVINIVEELLEASSDVQHVEQFDFPDKRTATKSEELEKNFNERMENLHIRTKSDEDENKVSKEPIHLVFGGKNIFPDKIQTQANSNALSKPFVPDVGGAGGGDNSNVANVYLINWHESPFPVDEVPLMTTLEITDTKPKPRTCDRETYTDPYDFNVAYIGGTDDYKILQAVNRNIIETSRHLSSDVEEPPMQKLVLHKSTMTNTTTLFRGPIFDLDTGISEEDYSEELIERFSHLPRTCVLDIYKNLCKHDYNWALDYLSNMDINDINMYSIVEQVDVTTKGNEITDENSISRKHFVTNAAATVTKKVAHPNSSESLTETCDAPQQLNQQSHSRTKRQRYKASDDMLALKQQLESKFVMNKERYTPHMLRIDLMKKHELDKLKMKSPEKVEVKKPSHFVHMPMAEKEEEQPVEDEDSIEDEVVEEEMMELRLGYDFIRLLESVFGNANFQAPEGLFPVIQIRKSMAQELYALWIESVQRQLWAMQEQLDIMIAQDAEYAKSLDAAQSRAAIKSDVPNLKEIMDMEMALAMYSNDCIEQQSMKKTHKDIASHVMRQTLHEMFPGYDTEMLYEIYEAHDQNFDETVKVIEENCSIKSTITMADMVKKRKHLIDELQKESSYQTSRHNQLETLESRDEASGGDYNNYENLQTYEEIFEVASSSRAEARRQLTLRNQNYQKASEAYRRKNPEVAAYYSNVAKLHIRNMEAANSMAASAFLAAQTRILDADDTLDLHFLHVSEAIQAFNIFLEYQLSQLATGARKYIYIITGRGTRSFNSQSKIKPIIVRKLNSKNIRFSEANPGMLKALLRKK
ncbi:PREDICTED: uncharacterized protein LOC105366280 [Ceratosolen solmsi marchali]|uniref:Uncharacterized protein LOC105366280 n=1 Tax=Ceratosolen solmsi marchali TaxID=326594 RepID=A0AAJ6YRN9_9HYME|nr:PREDICTED: uncharacterized protein LOC105366280 [Ceratosolen solmsi marchali]